uniref:Protein phosphatase methylesterase 1 n=1 Tax=Panagrellus redivivus TaxID=6233 RepID=A0A7E4UZE1_PANRE
MEAVDLSPLPWDAYGFTEKQIVDVDGDQFNVYRGGDKGIAVICIHGAGYTGLSFAQLAKFLLTKMECQVIAPDLRGHGETKCAEPMDLSKPRLVADVAAIYEKLFPDEDTRPYAFVVGHSMGGSVAIRLCHDKLIPKVLSLVVIDVVEGTALAALADMPTVLRHRPKVFKTLEKAVQWASTSGDSMSRLPGSRQSVPSQLKKTDAGYEWIVDLAATKPFWLGWFQGISKEFLACSQGKILIIGHVDRLDVELTRAEIQGQYQNVIVRDAGHAIHENDPEHVADAIHGYYQRFAVLIQKGLKIHI